MSSASTIHVTLKPSRVLRVLGILLYGVASAMVAALAMHRPILWILFALIALLGWRSDRCARLRHPGTPVGFLWAADHRLHWKTSDGLSVDGRCIEAQSWGAFWVRLRIREPNRRSPRVLIVPADAVDTETHRRLRVRCRVAAPPGPRGNAVTQLR